jgi:hypothetical protein
MLDCDCHADLSGRRNRLSGADVKVDLKACFFSRGEEQALVSGLNDRRRRRRTLVDEVQSQNRRNSIRLRMSYPAMVTRYDNKGRKCEQKLSKSMDVSLVGIRLKSNFPVNSGERLDITIALRDKLVTFEGKVIHVEPCEDQGFELGIAIEDIENPYRIAMNQFFDWIQTEVECEE